MAESVWDKQSKRSKTRIVYNFGRVDDPEVVERLRKLACSILRRCAPEELAGEVAGVRLVDAWPFGDQFVLDALWQRLGVDAIIRSLSGRGMIGCLVMPLFPAPRPRFAGGDGL